MPPLGAPELLSSRFCEGWPDSLAVLAAVWSFFGPSCKSSDRSRRPVPLVLRSLDQDAPASREVPSRQSVVVATLSRFAHPQNISVPSAPANGPAYSLQ